MVLLMAKFQEVLTDHSMNTLNQLESLLE